MASGLNVTPLLTVGYMRQTQTKRNPLKKPKKRSHVSAGYGRIGKHCKHLGGRGNAGGMHQHRIFFNKYHPGYFGKVSMRYFHKLRNKFYCPIININKLWSLIPEDVKAKANKDSARR
ncbi:Ribosomal protein L18e/L15P [Corchorus olitorius]|uniref:Ribosomal protein L18e/L15P n=1 Tax=Corchorus olitorius TaxID=93759 RepID=A0A1R3HG71_9ROSI|nr:Ribosomal protein L18e/L15P [Corchorus olitorius]